MMRRGFALLACLLSGFLAPAASAQVQVQPQSQAQRGPVPADSPLVTDLSSHLIAITSNFTGTELLIYGAVDEPGDIVIVVRGPPGAAVVREKSRAFGVWLNRRSMPFDNVPGYYAVASTRPLDQIANAPLLQRLQIGEEYLRFRYTGLGQEPDTAAFRKAILRLKRGSGLFDESVGSVAFLGPKLFRTAVAFPSTVPVGTYQAEVYLIRGERIIAAQATPLFIDKQGVEQTIFDFSRREPVLYGLASVLLAVFAGWIAAIAFRRA